MRRFKHRARIVAIMLAVMTPLGIGAATAGAGSGFFSADDGGKDWPAGGRDQSDQHFSPLTQVNEDTVGRLGLAWYWDLPKPQLAISVPLEVGGVIYTATGYSIVRAFSASTGKLLWEYDPVVRDRRMAQAWGIRGLAYWKGHILFGAVDGRLMSVNARTGKLVWSMQTLQKGDSRYISGAPRVFGDKVIIGHGGAEFGANRGYVTAFDAAGGRQLWRFFTVPGDPAKGFENKAMALAAQTWTGQWWKFGGGGTVWDAITYDPELDRLYIGTSNGEPWNHKIRSPQGGDNLFVTSIVALDANTGDYIWHYQVNPGDSWDYTATQNMVMATLAIDGRPRKVLMQAPKNGFFYVLDRETGKLIGADKYDKVTWADHVDLDSGRPVENPNARYQDGHTVIWPGPVGAHSWQPMAFNPNSGLVYIPTMTMPGSYDDRGIDLKAYRAPQNPFTLHGGLNIDTTSEIPADAGTSSLVAWDPVGKKTVWRVEQPGGWYGGTLTTAGNLVFQGRADGKLVAYSADKGKPLWTFDAQVGIVGTPISYWVDGRQYVSILAGFGGSGLVFGEMVRRFGWDYRSQKRRLLTFVLDGTQSLPAPGPRAQTNFIDALDYRPNPTLEQLGSRIFVSKSCYACHGFGAIAAGGAPDLRASAIVTDQSSFDRVVIKGALESAGMPKFYELTPAETGAIRQYILSRARLARVQESGESVSSAQPAPAR
jgi:quinohemoprotein ethanol dehydrogenase